jgi:serine/threonine protein kinase
MGINLVESIRGEQIFEYRFPEFLNENNDVGDKADDFEVLQVLGQGAFGNVLKVKSKKTLEIYAMKKVHMKKIEEGMKEIIKENKKFDKTKAKKYFENEKIILDKLKSPFTIRCYKIFDDEDFMYFVMEFMNNGDLLSYYNTYTKLKSKIPEEQLWELFFKCISGLLYIHNLGIIHRDIKLDNLFLDDNFNIKIGDFNTSAVINKKIAENFTDDKEKTEQMVSRNSYVGTPNYMAPELFLNDEERKYDQKVDVFAMGKSFSYLAPKKKKLFRRVI